MTDKDIRQTDCTFNRRLHRHATRMWSEALWTMYPTRRSCEASGMDVMLVSHYTRSVNPPGNGQNLNTPCHHCGTWKPLPFAQNIRQGNRKKPPWTMGVGWCKKPRPAGNRLDMLTCTRC